MTRRGTTLVELLTAITLIGLAVSGVAGMTVYASRRSWIVQRAARQSTFVVRHTERLTAVPFDSLPAQAGCLYIPDAVVPHRRCLTVTDVAPGWRRLRLVVTPTPPLRPDTVEWERARGVPYSPLQ